MNPDYPVYDEYSECPKCGHDRALSEYRAPVPFYISDDMIHLGAEYISRKCLRCGALRREAPLNPEPTP